MNNRLDVNKHITDNFNDNISYLQTHQPELFAKLSALESAIENGHYQEKYSLVYENEQFDVLEIQSGKYLYNLSSTKHTQESFSFANFYIKESLFQGFEQHSFTEEELLEFKKDHSLSSHLPSIAPIIDYINKNTPEKKQLEKIYKFIFFGVGLGLHIDKMDAILNASYYLIVEDDLELFRLSLFTCNYKNLSKDAQLTFSIFNDKKESKLVYDDFLKKAYYYNHYIKYFYLTSHKEHVLDDFHMALTSQPHIRFLFHNLFREYTQPLNYLFDDYKFLTKQLNFQNSSLSETPFLLIAMGPSLEKNIDWLQENKENFIIAAVSSSLSFLEKYAIAPDIIVHSDPFEWGDISFKKLQDISFIKNSLCIFSTATPTTITSLLDKEQLYFFETGTSYKESTPKLSSPCVGSLMLQMFVVFRAQEIYLLGLDLAVDTETLQTHSSGHNSNKLLTDEKDLYKGAPVEIKGNFSKQVKTTPHFNASIESINYFLPKFLQEQQIIYNLSDGAYFTQTRSIEADKVTIACKSNKEVLRSIIEKNSTKELNRSEMQKIKEKITHAETLLLILSRGISYNSIEKVLNIEEDIYRYELSRIIDTYLRYILSYIYDFLNISKLTDKESHMKKLNTMLEKSLIAIVQAYKGKLNARD